MDANSLIITLIIGAVAGWLAGQIFQGGGLGLIGNIIVGIVGGLVASWLFPMLGMRINIGSPIVSTILTSTIGAIVVLFLVSLVKRT